MMEMRRTETESERQMKDRGRRKERCKRSRKGDE